MIEFYATTDCDSIRPYMPSDVAYMLPASSWSRKNMRAVKLPAHVKRVAADCGGFVATKIWGDYRYTPARYVEWLNTFKPIWAATMDYCCENEITSGKAGIVRERQHRTTELAKHFWQNYKHLPLCWVPTIQGWHIEDYIYHARQLKSLIHEMRDYYGITSEFRVGIGTLCARADSRMVRDVVNAVSTELHGIPFHLWGVKLDVLKSVYAMPQVISVDSAAWNGLFGSDLQKYKASGLKQREYTYQVALPAYLKKFDHAVFAPKQLKLL